LRPARAVAALTLLAVTMRLPFLFRAPADLDETWSWYFVELVRSGRGLLETFLIGLDGPLYVGLDLLIAAVTGNALPALRVPAAVFGTLAVPLAWAALVRLHGPRLGLVTAALTALSPFLIYFSMQARPYAQMLAGCLLFAWAAAAPSADRSSWERAGILGAAFVAVASHYYAIVFLGTWYALRAGAALLDRRWRAGRAEVLEGLLVLAALVPLLALLLRRLGSLGVGYWQSQDLGLAEILTEELFLSGTSLGGPGAFLGLVLILLPFLLTAWRRPRLFLEHPWLLLGPAMPLVAAAGGRLLGESLFFYPRAYIGSTPFLLAALALLVPVAFRRAWLRRVYAAALLVPFLASMGFAALASPRHPFYHGREVLEEIVDNVAALGQDYDVVAVHHWFLTQFVAYHHPEPERIAGLGMFRRGAAARLGEIPAVLLDVEALPPGARVLLMRNALASQGSDSDGAVRAALEARRPLLRALNCRSQPLPGEEILCDRLFLFGPEPGRLREEAPAPE
jgi:hypothetical protein